MSREWTVVIKGDWYLPHFVNMLREYRGNGEQTSCATEVIGQIESQMVAVPGDRTMKTTRPLVVIDPEDREQVERLTAAITEHRAPGPNVHNVKAALREFANPTPPKPDEPLGRYAAVETSDGLEFVRLGDGPRPWMHNGSPGNRDTYAWSDIAAVRVLSPGYTEDGAS